MKSEHIYYHYDEFSYNIKLEQLGLALDYARNTIDNSINTCSECQQMEIVDNLTDAILKNKISLFKKNISKKELWNIIYDEIFNKQTKFGESLKTREFLDGDIFNKSVVLNGYSDGLTYLDIVRGDAISLINQIKGYGSKEAYERFVGIFENDDKPLEMLVQETIDKSPKFEEIVNKLIKNDVTYTDFQRMIEMFIRRSMVTESRKDMVSKLLAKGFNSTASKMVHVVANVLTNEDIEILCEVNPRVLFNMGVSKKLVKEKNKTKKREQYLAKLKEKQQIEFNQQQGLVELTSEQHYVAINDQIRNLTKLVSERKRNIANLKPEETIYQFDVVDFLMTNRYSFKTLTKNINDKIKQCENHPVYGFYANKLKQTLKFLKLAEKYSKSSNIDDSYSYMINGGIRKATNDEIEFATDYLNSIKVPVNAYTLSNSLRRLLVGGDINSKYDKNCLQAKKNVEELDDEPVL